MPAPLSIPPELKKIAPYIKRAEELDKDKANPESRLVAYYCRQYAVHLGIPLAGAAPGAKGCLAELLGALEQEKPAMDNFTRDEAAFLCRKFSEGVFNKADAEDRAGRASKSTAKVFYAAASFLQMLEQFYDEDDESEQVEEDKKRIVYSKWKATEILKAIKEGREPTPGGYGEDEKQEEEEAGPATATSMGGGTMGDESAPENEQGFETPFGAPSVETVNEDSDDGGLPPAPKWSQPPVQPPPPPLDDEPQFQPVNMEMDEPKDNEGTEVALGPPPAYPSDDDDAAHHPTRRADRPALTFDLPPVNPTPLPPPSPPKHKSGGLFGLGKKKGTSKLPATKAMVADAAELTRFALAALEEKDVELGAERLQQALEALGR